MPPADWILLDPGRVATANQSASNLMKHLFYHCVSRMFHFFLLIHSDIIMSVKYCPVQLWRKLSCSTCSVRTQIVFSKHLGVRKSNWSLIEWWGAGMVNCLECPSEVQMTCIWSTWCHCHSVISCFIKMGNVLLFWCWLAQIVLKIVVLANLRVISIAN